jgi:hypothetical protein
MLPIMKNVVLSYAFVIQKSIAKIFLKKFFFYIKTVYKESTEEVH